MWNGAAFMGGDLQNQGLTERTNREHKRRHGISCGFSEHFSAGPAGAEDKG
jgi:hypothetical protein